MLKTDRNYIDFCKVLLSFLVVLGHVFKMYSPETAINTGVECNFLRFVYRWIYTFHMPAFILISGFVFQECKECGKYSKYILFVKNKFGRLMVPYFSFAAMLVLPTRYIIEDKITPPMLENYINSFLLGLDMRHLWYLYTLFVLFLFFDLLYKILIRYRTIVTVFLTILSVCSALSTAYFAIGYAFHYAIYFWIGMMLSILIGVRSNGVSLMHGKIIVAGMLMLNIVLFLIGYHYLSIEIVHKSFFLLSSICGIFFFFIMSSYIHGIIAVKLESTIYKILRRNTFGIYLFNESLIWLLYFALSVLKLNPYLMSSIVTVVVILTSIFICTVLRGIKLSCIIGE